MSAILHQDPTGGRRHHNDLRRTCLRSGPRNGQSRGCGIGRNHGPWNGSGFENGRAHGFDCGLESENKRASENGSGNESDGGCFFRNPDHHGRGRDYVPCRGRPGQYPDP